MCVFYGGINWRWRQQALHNVSNYVDYQSTELMELTAYILRAVLFFDCKENRANKLLHVFVMTHMSLRGHVQEDRNLLALSWFLMSVCLFVCMEQLCHCDWTGGWRVLKNFSDYMPGLFDICLEKELRNVKTQISFFACYWIITYEIITCLSRGKNLLSLSFIRNNTHFLNFYSLS